MIENKPSVKGAVYLNLNFPTSNLGQAIQHGSVTVVIIYSAHSIFEHARSKGHQIEFGSQNAVCYTGGSIPARCVQKVVAIGENHAILTIWDRRMHSGAFTVRNEGEWRPPTKQFSDNLAEFRSMEPRGKHYLSPATLHQAMLIENGDK